MTSVYCGATSTETAVCDDCILSSMAEDDGRDSASLDTADAAMRSANFDVRSKLFSFSMPCKDESIYKRRQTNTVVTFSQSLTASHWKSPIAHSCHIFWLCLTTYFSDNTPGYVYCWRKSFCRPDVLSSQTNTAQFPVSFYHLYLIHQ